MKKISIAFLIISIIALVLAILMDFVWLNDNSRRSNFISQWLWVPLLPLLIPVIGRNITIHFITKNPRIWVIIHGTVAIVWILVQVFAFSFIQRTMDLSLCIRKTRRNRSVGRRK